VSGLILVYSGVFLIKYLAGTARALRAIPELPEVLQGVFQAAEIFRAGVVSISLLLYRIWTYCRPSFHTFGIAFHNEFEGPPSVLTQWDVAAKTLF
jgi:hypothetical protein